MSDFLSNFEKANKNAKRLSNKILIDGRLISPSTNNKIDVINPSTGENIGEAPQCNKVEVDLAVKSSLNAFKEWKKVPCLLYTSPSPRDLSTSRMPSSA